MAVLDIGGKGIASRPMAPQDGGSLVVAAVVAAGACAAVAEIAVVALVVFGFAVRLIFVYRPEYRED